MEEKVKIFSKLRTPCGTQFKIFLELTEYIYILKSFKSRHRKAWRSQSGLRLELVVTLLKRKYL